jgi:ATP-dependent Lon protease
MIMRMRKLPDGRIKILIQGLTKARITSFEDHQEFFKVNLMKVENEDYTEETHIVEALMRSVRENLEQVISQGKVLSPDILMVLEDIQDPGRLADLVASNLNLKVEDAQAVLEVLNPVDRLQKINDILLRELEILAVQAKIKGSAKEEISKLKKNIFYENKSKLLNQNLVMRA